MGQSGVGLVKVIDAGRKGRRMDLAAKRSTYIEPRRRNCLICNLRMMEDSEVVRLAIVD